VKPLKAHRFDPLTCRQEWAELDNLLKSKAVLSERTDVLPFFKARQDLSILICSYFPNILNPDRIKHEYAISGDFVADLVVGDSVRHHYLLVEFENGAPDSVFRKKSGKTTPDWSPRLEGAYSQLTDWLWKLDDLSSTSSFATTFGDRQAHFEGLIVLGKGMNLDAQERSRLRWRVAKTRLNSIGVSCVSFEELRDDLDAWLTHFHRV
jgi:hypothetical protein